MSVITHLDATMTGHVRELVIRERALALSARELNHRLAGYGYGIRDTKEGQIVEKLTGGVAICAMPTDA